MTHTRLAVACWLAFVIPLRAQTPRSVSPGMSRAQVVERLGTPLTSRTSGSSSFLFYQNGCERRCGMHDVVVLENDQVVDAIFRSAARVYTGVSSSPAAESPTEAAQRSAAAVVHPSARQSKHQARSAAAGSQIRIPMPSGSTPEATDAAGRARQTDTARARQEKKKPET